VTDEDPGNVDHVEIVLAGDSGSALGFSNGVLGVSPITCRGVIERSIAFVFASRMGSDAQRICGTVAHEAGHSFSLEHRSGRGEGRRGRANRPRRARPGRFP